MMIVRSLTTYKGMLGILVLGISLNGALQSRAQQEQPLTVPTTATTPKAGILSSVKVGNGPSAIAVNPVTNRVYTAHYMAGTVTVLDGNTLTVLDTIKVGGRAYGIAVNTVTNRIYVGNNANDLLSVIDGTTNTVMATVKTGGRPNSIAVNSATNRIYLTCRQDQTFRIVDGNTNAIQVTKNLNSDIVALNPIADRVYIALGRQVLAFTGTIKSLLAGIHVDGDPVAMAVNPATNRLYVATHEGTLVVIDGRINTIVTRVKVGKYPAGIAVNPDTCQVFVANLEDNTMSVLDGTTNVVSATVPMAENGAPRAVAVNPVTQQVFVANYQANTISTFDGRAYMTESAHAYARTPRPPFVTLFSPLVEKFTDGTIDFTTRWSLVQRDTSPGATIDVVGTEAAGRRLRMHLNGLGLHGICTRDAVVNFDDATPTEITVVVDWSTVVDARYLVAGLVISPGYSEEADFSAKADDFIELLYHGEDDIRPTANAHLAIRASISNGSAAAGSRGGTYTFFDEGYQATVTADNPFFPGRKLGVQHLRIVISDTRIAVWENEKLVCEKDFTKLERLKAPLPWSIGYLYLVMMSAAHLDDTPARDVYFGNISVRRLTEKTMQNY